MVGFFGFLFFVFCFRLLGLHIGIVHGILTSVRRLGFDDDDGHGLEWNGME